MNSKEILCLKLLIENHCWRKPAGDGDSWVRSTEAVWECGSANTGLDSHPGKNGDTLATGHMVPAWALPLWVLADLGGGFRVSEKGHVLGILVIDVCERYYLLRGQEI